MAELSDAHVWTRLRQLTPSRIGLGRVGSSVPTRALLEFELAHARARDAVHAPLDAEELARELRENGLGEAVVVASQAGSPQEYLLRPDMGRRLDAASRARLTPLAMHGSERPLVIVIADGLSAVAPARHVVPLFRELRGILPCQDLPLVIARRARVALGDEVGSMLRAEAVVVLIGERPGLSSPDSLGAYLTWAPRVGRTDAERNCISNIRPEGLPYADAARRLHYLLGEARRLQLTGVALKDDSDERATLLP